MTQCCRKKSAMEPAVVELVVGCPLHVVRSAEADGVVSPPPRGESSYPLRMFVHLPTVAVRVQRRMRFPARIAVCFSTSEGLEL